MKCILFDPDEKHVKTNYECRFSDYEYDLTYIFDNINYLDHYE